jgi:hypothetical protein
MLYMIMTVCAVAFHDNTFAVFDLREQLQMLYINMWELLYQLEYVEPHQRLVVYEEIAHIRSEIVRVITELLAQDQTQHP